MVKRALVLISMVLIHMNGLCQNDSILGSFTAVGTPPVYSTKGDSIELFIKRNLEYPIEALEVGVEGEVIISFYIDTVGNTVNHKLIRGLTEELNIEALRIANLIRFEKPAMQNSKPISVIYFIKVEFELPCTKKK